MTFLARETMGNEKLYASAIQGFRRDRTGHYVYHAAFPFVKGGKNGRMDVSLRFLCLLGFVRVMR
jgi:hypothetical protein